MVLANTQEEPQVEGRIELKQDIGQFGSSIHDLQGLLNASETQLQSVVDTSQCMKQEEEAQPLDYSFLADADVEDMDKNALRTEQDFKCRVMYVSLDFEVKYVVTLPYDGWMMTVIREISHVF
ncbi:hypothetical protein HAX54_000718 [Datura stramonium]|uniref:Uncharacterized protein n=1 Tax=Datura stramonium TaxID=4076 RepID=A0ABS8WV24_DATST|nr:hypothetical protein [Datura stramonium]